MEQMNCYLILGFHTVGHLATVEVTDELVERHYLRIKRAFEEKMQEMFNNGKREDQIRKLKESLEQVESAYNTLKTEEDRTNYESKYVKKKIMRAKINQILNQEDESNKGLEIETVRVNKNNKAIGVREEKVDLSYDIKYQDEDVVLMETEKMRFLNGGVINQDLSKYFIIMQKQENLDEYIHEFYSKIYFSKMQEKEYRIALYKTIKKAIQEERNYVGAIEKKGDNYKEVWDDGEYDAMQKYEQSKKNSFLKEKGEGR